jgi:hypothetical protein
MLDFSLIGPSVLYMGQILEADLPQIKSNRMTNK